jgi:Bardet-Biedl syndrome 9 protein
VICDWIDKIITGSYHGVLRIYLPHGQGFNVNDLMYEKNLDEPILQVEAGRFSG